MTPITPGTHLDHLLRQTRMHHVQLSAMADVKANIMLTLAAVVTTFSIGYLNDPLLRWPVVVLIFFILHSDDLLCRICRDAKAEF